MKNLSLPTTKSTAQSIKRISTDQLRPGMFLTGVEESWWKSPFFRHKRLIKHQQDIDVLRQSGILEVLIDTSRGLDVDGEDEDNQDDASSTESCVFSQEESETDQVHMQDQENEHETTQPHDSTPWETACLVREEAIMAVEGIFEGVKTGVPIDQPVLQKTVKNVLEQVLTQGSVLAEAILLQNAKHFDKNLYAHVIDVAALSALVGVHLELDRDLLEWMTIGAIFHDVGQIRLPRNLMCKRGNLLEDEEKLFRKHPEIGWTMLTEFQGIPEESRRIVLEHHERLDGSGYPKGIGEADLSLLSGVVGMIDQFDELVSPWGSGSPMPAAMAIRSLFQEAKSRKLSQGPVEAMIKCLGVYPLGSCVQLETGERAIVLKGNSTDRLKPLVKIISDSGGNPTSVPSVVDLTEGSPETQGRAITSVLDPGKYKIDVLRYLDEV